MKKLKPNYTNDRMKELLKKLKNNRKLRSR